MNIEFKTINWMANKTQARNGTSSILNTVSKYRSMQRSSAPKVTAELAALLSSRLLR